MEPFGAAKACGQVNASINIVVPTVTPLACSQASRLMRTCSQEHQQDQGLDRCSLHQEALLFSRGSFFCHAPAPCASVAGGSACLLVLHSHTRTWQARHTPVHLQLPRRSISSNASSAGDEVPVMSMAGLLGDVKLKVTLHLHHNALLRWLEL